MGCCTADARDWAAGTRKSNEFSGVKILPSFFLFDA